MESLLVRGCVAGLGHLFAKTPTLSTLEVLIYNNTVGELREKGARLRLRGVDIWKRYFSGVSCGTRTTAYVIKRSPLYPCVPHGWRIRLLLKVCIPDQYFFRRRTMSICHLSGLETTV